MIRGQSKSLAIVYALIMLVIILALMGPIQSWSSAVVASSNFPPETAYLLDVMPFLLLLFIIVGAGNAVSKTATL